MDKIKSFLQAVWHRSFKLNFKLELWQLALDIGWYPGNPFKLFCVTLGEPQTNYNDKIDYLSFVTLQVVYFIVDFYWQKQGD